MRRGEIWWADLPSPSASEPGYRRPVLIVSSDDFNRSRIQTVIAVALTTNLALADAPGNVRLAPDESGLARESVANVSQVLTLNKTDLTDQAGKISERLMVQVEDGLRLALEL